MLSPISILVKHAPGAIALMVAISTFSEAALAQYHPARADSQGDYYTLDVGDRGYQSQWVVVANKLNCRIKAGSNYPVLVTWHKNVKLTVETPDESQVIKKDANGKPWLRVKFDRNVCFVRANSKYIKPL
jgi:uncharacterized protein YgiM (DUF1202 family)